MTKTPKERILEEGEWVGCWICYEVFKRSRGTLRYCDECHRGFCDDEHGKFHQYGGVYPKRGICIICFSKIVPTSISESPTDS
jgi:hypothetical protein